MGWVSIVKYPLLLILGFTIQLLSYLLSTLLFLASPVIYIGHVVLYLALLPLRILIALEAFIYFMTGAVLVGAAIGMILHFAGSTISQVLQIGESDEPRRPRVKQELLDSQPQRLSFDYLEAKAEDRKFLPYSTILEEEENSHESG
ncbi:unnamed protein product [Penicillium nalgiovense]|uniref:Uncharacterized protein n=1 Tax=Penicillium nalgiovense TaxID=60175 RepID=A0A9W4HZ19_PENNA|nr:unnamed protein product [Penicillium nalgiovense]CAG7999431.1 unnamed protein product [Penicillium nalgiovense]CAG8082751.1 unnamed protein product [Penicillium nalgiovense]CAG8102586.1 unnamed protein product [Penicillium nalgiovense]CAG8109873.1 unnamed protein product [Penicillium nalgiovense]